MFLITMENSTDIIGSQLSTAVVVNTMSVDVAVADP
jgi:hypothetical protein